MQSFIFRTFYFLITLLPVFVGTACMQTDEGENKIATKYFNIVALMEQQEKLLNKYQPKVEKKGIINGETEVTKPDNINWKKEIGLFAEADINKTSWKDSYKTDTLYNKPKTQQTIRYMATDAEIPVRWMRVTYEYPNGNLWKVEANVREKNMLYHSEHAFALFFKNLDNQAILDKYFVKGYQKLILKKAVNFELQGQLIY